MSSRKPDLSPKHVARSLNTGSSQEASIPRRSPRKRLANEASPTSESQLSSFSQHLSGFAYPNPQDGPPSKKRMTSAALPPTKKVIESPGASPSHETPPILPTPPIVVAKPKNKKSIQLALDKAHPAPANWAKQYDLIKEMRRSINAPVDTMGCATSMSIDAEPRTKRFVTLISLMLSSQTKDEVTWTAINNLRRDLGELTIENVLAASDNTIQDAICKVGFWRRKTKYIRETSQKLREDFDSDVPKTVDALCSLPGVGPKMAFLALQTAWNLNHGIGVDVHVHRITNRIGWHKPPTSTPEQTRLNLQSWLPSELHTELNPVLVGFGQVVCLPVGPRCDTCALSSQDLCPSARTVKPKNKNRTETKALVEIKYETAVEAKAADEDDHEAAGGGSNGSADSGGVTSKIEIDIEERGSAGGEKQG